MIPRKPDLSVLLYIQAAIMVFIALYFAGALFIPMCYGLLVAVILYPLCKKLEQRGWPRSLSITAGLLLVAIIFTVLIGLLVVEVKMFRKDLPDLTKKFQSALVDFQQWISIKFGISTEAQNGWWQDIFHNLIANPGAVLKKAFYATAGTFVMLFLVPVYTALFLYNRGLFVRFLAGIIPYPYKQHLPEMLDKAIDTYSRFIKGMLWVYLIVGVLNSIGFFVLGIEHAILFGMLTAVMTIIPYVGIIISSLLPITIAWITKDSIWYPVGVIAILTFVQYLEANIIFPKVVATQLNVSTWATLVAIITGGLLWGISGMILFIPFVGILKIIFEQIPSAQPFNILLSREDGSRQSAAGSEIVSRAQPAEASAKAGAVSREP